MSAAKFFLAAVTSLAICAVAVRGETCAEVVDGVALIPEGTLTIAEDVSNKRRLAGRYIIPPVHTEILIVVLFLGVSEL